ncbi:MAG: hypothetical protein QG670_2891 [Thermoproteota archaeon]|nr:hypothetical protein [Thermoproteota archaeon]
MFSVDVVFIDVWDLRSIRELTNKVFERSLLSLFRLIHKRTRAENINNAKKNASIILLTVEEIVLIIQPHIGRKTNKEINQILSAEMKDKLSFFFRAKRVFPLYDKLSSFKAIVWFVPCHNWQI